MWIITAIVGWNRRRLQVRRYLEKAYRDPDVGSFEQAECLQEALIQSFVRQGLVRVVVEATRFPLYAWHNGNRSKGEPKFWPMEGHWAVDILRYWADWQQNRVVGCRSPMADRLNTSWWIFAKDLRLSLTRHDVDDIAVVNIHYWMDGDILIRGEEATFSGKLPDDPGQMREVVLSSMQKAMGSPKRRQYREDKEKVGPFAVVA